MCCIAKNEPKSVSDRQHRKFRFIRIARDRWRATNPAEHGQTVWFDHSCLCQPGYRYQTGSYLGRDASQFIRRGLTGRGTIEHSILAARTLIEKDPDYTYATARLLLHTIAKEVLGQHVDPTEMGSHYAEYFPRFIKQGVTAELLDERLQQFDLQRLGKALKAERDLQFDYLGLQTLYDRYFLHVRKTRIELPQAFFMRVAMGLALNEIDRETRAIEFYEVLSSFDFMSSTPTLFNSGTLRSQLSSCYLTTVPE